MVAKKLAKAPKTPAKTRKSTAKRKSPTPIAEDDEVMTADVGDSEADESVEEEEEEEEEKEERPMEDEEDSQDLHKKLVDLNKKLIAEKLVAEKKKADKTMKELNDMFDDAEEVMVQLETSPKGHKGHCDKVTQLFRGLDQHLKSGVIDVLAVQTEKKELELSVAQMTSQVDVYLKDQLSPYVQHLENVTTAYNDRSIYLRAASEKGNRIRKRALDKLRDDDQIQTDAVIVTDMLYKIKGIETR